MSFKLLNKNDIKLKWDLLDIKNTDNNIIIFKKYNNILIKSKNNIDNVNNIYKWDKIKKLVNPYESIFVKNNNYSDSISNYKPVSRSFFKFIELNKKFNLIKDNKYVLINNSACCIAEAPGGFIESIFYKYPNINIYGLSVYPKNNYIPNWNKLRSKINRKKISNINLNYGDLYSINDIKHFIKKLKNTNINIITADCGFDFSKNYDNQEIISHHIIFNEIITCFLILSKGGNFVCKIFDIFNIFTIQIIILLQNMFNEVNIYKPKTSRVANSEKYLICKNFKGINKNIEENCFRLLKKIKECKEKNNFLFIENLKIPNDIIQELNKINLYFIKEQVYYLDKTIEFIKKEEDLNNDILNELKKKQINNAIEWCNIHDIDINNKYL